MSPSVLARNDNITGCEHPDEDGEWSQLPFLKIFFQRIDPSILSPVSKKYCSGRNDRSYSDFTVGRLVTFRFE